jgi:hypothetical protein
MLPSQERPAAVRAMPVLNLLLLLVKRIIKKNANKGGSGSNQIRVSMFIIT